MWQRLKRPARNTAIITLMAAGFIIGIVFWGGFNWSMEMTNNEEFCISCHEMEANVYREYQDTVHYSNRT
ncbi:MAG: NapC/NirT family cytochrome c, partial [Magnetovibrio sp.]|nr:NapC/NirT family cytochrome c [Magnetovibrio sp.]